MGLMCSWIAVKGADKDALLDELKLVETSAKAMPGSRDALFSYAELGGWVIIFSHYFGWADRGRVRDLSRFGLTVGCRLEDKADMMSVAYAAQDGEELWCVFHVNGPRPRRSDGRPGTYRLDVSGEPPPELEAIRDRLFKEQDEADRGGWSTDYIHEIPIELAASVCGFSVEQNEAWFIALEEMDQSGMQDDVGWVERLLAMLFAPGSRRQS